MIMLTYDGNIWYPSLYDLDSTWGTWSTGALSESYDYTPDNAESKLLSRTINLFGKELANRWFELRKTNLSKTSILNEFNTFINSIPKEVYENQIFDNIQINYKKEAKLGDTIKCKYIYDGNVHKIVLVNAENENLVHAIIELF